MTDAELRGLLLDCLKLWTVDGRLVQTEEGWDIETAEGAYSIARAEYRTSGAPGSICTGM